jgi:hypothetical protein
VITVDGQAVHPGDDGSDGGGVQEVLRAARLELRLCRALVALRPTHDVSLLVHVRAAELLRVLRVLRKHDAADEDAIPSAELGDGELKEAAGLVRAFHALPSCRVKGFPGGITFRAVLGEYALDLATELDARTAGTEQAVSEST